MEKTREPVEFSITRYSPNGKVTEKTVTREGGNVVVRSVLNPNSDAQVLGPVSGGISSALFKAPGLLSVEPGATEITCDPDLLPQLLGMLSLQQTPQSLGIEDPGKALGDVLSQDAVSDFELSDEVLSALHIGAPAVIIPVWLNINQYRAFVLSTDEGSAVGLLDMDTQTPLLTRTLLEWGFYSVSGGPVSWDGNAALGECGPGVWCLVRTGDVEPGSWLFLAPKQDALAAQIARFLREARWEIPFVLAEVGMPGLTEEECSRIGDVGDVEGPWVDSYLSAEVAQEVLDILESSGHLKRAIDALRDPESPAGLATYGWLRQLIYGEDQSASWNHVHRAMIGEIGPPDPRLAPHTMTKQWQATVEAASAAVAASLGYAPPVRIPKGLGERVTLAEMGPFSTLDYRTLIEDLLDSTSQEAMDRAAVTLGCEPSPRVTAAWKAYEQRAAENPQRREEFLDAYETILRREDRLRQLEEYRAKFAEAEHLRTRLESLDWPSNWSHQYAPLWLELGGTSESAQAWASAGWSVREVLLEPQLRLPWNVDIDERVQSVEVPAKPLTET